jgi:thioester reductase-like protein
MLITRRLKIKCTYRKNGKWPNTYTFSKALAEEIIQKLNGRLPVAIFRPSMGEREKYTFL